MILSTTEELQGFEITEYLGLVSGEVVSGANIVRDVMATVTDFVGGRSAAYEETMQTSREAIARELTDRARRMGADGVVGHQRRFRGDRRARRDDDGLGRWHRGKAEEALGFAGVRRWRIVPRLRQGGVACAAASGSASTAAMSSPASAASPSRRSPARRSPTPISTRRRSASCPRGDQTAALQAALKRGRGRAAGRCSCPPASIAVTRPHDSRPASRVIGVQGQTRLVGSGTGPVARISGSSDVVLEALCVRAGRSAGRPPTAGCSRSRPARTSPSRAAASPIPPASGSSSFAELGRDRPLRLRAAIADAAIFSRDSNGARHHQQLDQRLRRRRHPDLGHRRRSTRTARSSSATRSRTSTAPSGGNGQNGNGINVFQADRVIVADNQISDCAFTAVRLNGDQQHAGARQHLHQLGRGRDLFGVRVLGLGDRRQHHRRRRDRASRSPTSIRADGLRPARGNIVRNIAEQSLVNPDTRPVGIYAEADTVDHRQRGRDRAGDRHRRRLWARSCAMS